LPFAVVEDSGGGLHLYVFDTADLDGCVYAHSGYERVLGQLAKDVAALMGGATVATWDGNAENPQEEWDYWEGQTHGWKVVHDCEGPSHVSFMGAAARKEFYPDED